MNLEPGKSYGVASRCICSICGKVPTGLRIWGADPVYIEASCCNNSTSIRISKKELLFGVRFFEKKEQFPDDNSSTEDL